jgi:hypothetical protein
LNSDCVGTEPKPAYRQKGRPALYKYYKYSKL